MNMKARERVFCYVEQHKGQDVRDALYEAVRTEFPEFDLTSEWLVSRHEWMRLMIECGAEHVSIQDACTCLAVVAGDMGFEDTEVLRRAILFTGCSIPDVINAMRAMASI